MSAPDTGKENPATGREYTKDELDAMSRDELVALGAKLDGVDIAYLRDRWAVKDTRAERRAERLVAFWFAVAGLAGLGFLAAFLFWPWEYQGVGDHNYHWYSFATPMYGLLGISILAVGIGAVLYTKRFIPEEISIQDRHDGQSADIDRATIVAQLGDSLDKSTIGRRKLIGRTALFGAGALGLAAGVLFIGGMVKNPWAKRDKSPLWVSGWTPKYPGETIYLRRYTPDDTARVELVRPGESKPGSMETVFPFREEDRGNHEKLLEDFHGIRDAVMLIHLRTEDAAKAVKRKGQESFNYGDYFAYSKICTHLGCPTSLFEQQTNRILCPCHQSQFSATEWGKPIFGPAARALPQLPITIDEEGYVVAAGDFIEALGPAFWERRS